MTLNNGLLHRHILLSLFLSTILVSPQLGFAQGFQPQNNPPPFFEDEDFGDEDFQPVQPSFNPQNNEQGNQGRENTTPFSVNDGGTDSRAGGFTLGGDQKGVISGKNSLKQSAATVDDSGETGSNEIITDFNFPDAEIMDVAKALGKLTGKNFILDQGIKSKISIISNSPITVKDAWRAFLTALDIHALATIPSGKFIRIARKVDARDKQVPTYTGSNPDTDALITRVFPLKFISAQDFLNSMRTFLAPIAKVTSYDQTNTLIITDTGANIAKLGRIIDIIDVEGFDAGIEVITVKHASATELSKLIDTLLPSQQNNTAGNRMNPIGGMSGQRFTSRKTKEGGLINTIIADDRTNSLIIHANAKGTEQVKRLVKTLDRPIPIAQGGGKVHVIYLQFASSKALSETLNSLVSGNSGAQTRQNQPQQGFGAPVGLMGQNPIATAPLFEGNIRVAADETTNSLVITANPNDFFTIQRVVAKLDVPRDQVYAEVHILEVAMNKALNFSANILSPVSGLGSLPSNDLKDFIANPLSVGGAIIGFKTGRQQSISIGGQAPVTVSSIQGLITALQSNENINLVARPQILTMDNTEATVESGEKIPVRRTVATQGAIGTNIESQNVSIAIKLKPSINKLSSFVKLGIEAKLEDFSTRKLPDAVAGEGFAIINRTVKTEVNVADGDTVVLGGLVRDSVKDTTSKIPVLGDIPVLGWLFRAKGNETQKTNLLLFITPNIIRQPQEIRAVLDRKLKERDEFLEKTTGGRDSARSYRDDIIRSLPDPKKYQIASPVSGDIQAEPSAMLKPENNSNQMSPAPMNQNFQPNGMQEFMPQDLPPPEAGSVPIQVVPESAPFGG